MKSSPWTALCVALLAIAPGLAHAQGDRSGVRPEVISLPDGPGSIEGLGESFEPSPSSGTSGYGVSIRVPPGIAGFVPSPALRYSSGGGNSELGLGWSLGVPMVQRGTDQGLPRYDESDRIVLRGMQGRGAEDLVQLADGSWRFRIEGAFVRGRQRDDGSWEFRNRSGVRFRFGTSAAGTIRDGDRIFAWCLTEQEDLRGHLIRYEYERDATGHPYLSRIVYNDLSPEVRNEVVFEYEDRPDRVTSYLPTFGDTIARRVARIVVQHGGQLVRRYDLAYSMMLGLSRLVTVRMVGTDGVTALPTLTMGYVDFEPNAGDVVTMGRGPARALGTVAEIDDVDGDSLPDLLVTDPGLDGGRYSWIPNLDGDTWGERQVMSESPSVWLPSSSVQLADMDGDGAADVLARVSPASDGLRYHPATEGGFGAPVVIRPAPAGGFEAPDVRLVDLDHDRRTDWMRIDPTTGEVWVAFNEGEGVFTAATSMGRLDVSEVVSFSRSRLQLADANGDGMTDLVVVRSGSARYWPAMGFGQFGEAVPLPGAPTLSDGELAALQVRDLNGDGTADLVHVGVSRVRYWLNLAGIGLMATMSVDGTPELRPTTVVRLADMNGNGTADIVWIDSSSSTPWRYLDVLPRGTPGLLERIDNGLGRVTTIEYACMGQMRRWAREEGVDWTRRSPIGQTVLHRVSTDTGLDPTVVYELRYADGYLDGAHREFRGFGRALRFDLGDDEQPTLVTDMRFDVGDVDEALKGMSLQADRRAEGGAIFDRAASLYMVRTVDTAASGEAVRYAYQSRAEMSTFELGSSPVVVRSEWEHDDYGNITRLAEYGIVEGDDVGVGDDERVVLRTYATDRGRWILDRLATERTETVSGERLSEVHNFYDGEPFEGLGLGELGRYAEPTRAESWIEGDRFALVEAIARDEHGNVIIRRDERGGRREAQWDDAMHAYPVRERRFPSDDGDFALEWTAEYDTRFGVAVRMTDANGETGHAVLDELGRVTALVEPGDSEEFPSHRYEYRLGAPLSMVRSARRSEAGQEAEIVGFSFVDGMGRSRGESRAVGDGRWAFEGVQEHGARGWQTVSSRPFFTRSADLPALSDGAGGIHGFYDALGRSVRGVDVDGSETRRVYEPLVRWSWDANDTDPTSPHADTPSRTEIDGLGRTRRVIWQDGDRELVTLYNYDPLDNITEVVNAAGTRRRYRYDGRSRMREISDPSAGTWLMEYTDGGDLERRVDPTGNVVRLEHDGLGRTLAEWYQTPGESERRAIAYHYDAPSPEHPELGQVVGRLSWVEDEAGAVFLGYDARGRQTDRVRRFEDGSDYRTWNDYDTADRVVRRGFPDGTHLELDYDARGLLRSVGGLVSNFEWSAFGQLSEAVFGNGVTHHVEHDERQRAWRITDMNAAGERLFSYELRFDRASRVDAIVDQTPDIGPELSMSASYEYDDLYRLTRAAHATTEASWGYDDAGNILFAHSGGERRDYEYGEPTAPDQLTRVGGGLPFSYDAAGRVERDGARTLTWDARGRLSRVEHDDGRFEEYVYGYDGARTVKRAGREGFETSETLYIDSDVEVRDGQLTRYLFLGPLRSVRMDSTLPIPAAPGALSAGRVRALGIVGALLCALGAFAALFLGRRRGRVTASVASSAAIAVALVACEPNLVDPRTRSQPIEAWPADAVQYLHDPVGTVTVSVDARGEVASRASRVPYGASRAREGHPEPWGFGGNEEDDVGLGDFDARPYSPELGRFLAPDPVPIFEVGRTVSARPQAAALYGYAAGDPINAIDPNGEFVIVDDAAVLIGAVVVAAVVVTVWVGVSYAATGGPPEPPRWLQRGVDDAVEFITNPPFRGAARPALEAAELLVRRATSLQVGQQITEATATDPTAEDSEVVEIGEFLEGEGREAAAEHAEKAAGSGAAVEGRIDRAGAEERRRGRLKGIKTKAGHDRDEFPPAVLELDDPEAYSVEHIPSGPNRSSGAKLRGEIQDLPDGTRVRIRIPNGGGAGGS